MVVVSASTPHPPKGHLGARRTSLVCIPKPNFRKSVIAFICGCPPPPMLPEAATRRSRRMIWSSEGWDAPNRPDDPMINLQRARPPGHAEAAGFVEVHVELVIDVEPGTWVDDWDWLLGTAPNPNARTTGEAIAAALTSEEAERFEGWPTCDLWSTPVGASSGPPRLPLGAQVHRQPGSGPHKGSRRGPVSERATTRNDPVARERKHAAHLPDRGIAAGRRTRPSNLAKVGVAVSSPSTSATSRRSSRSVASGYASAPAAPAPQPDQLIHELTGLRLVPLLGGGTEQPNQLVLTTEAVEVGPVEPLQTSSKR